MPDQEPRFDGLFATLLNDDGQPPRDPPDDCDVCRPFSHQRPGEARADWIACITSELTRETS